MSKLVIKLDASAAKESSCIRRLYWNIVKGYRVSLQANDVEFGTAFHIFRKIIRTDKTLLSEALDKTCNYFSEKPMYIKPKKKYLDLEYLKQVCSMYYVNVVQDDDHIPIVTPSGEALLEQKFSLPYYTDEDVDILVCGTIDELGVITKGAHYIMDAKTTSMWNQDEFLNNYTLDAQMRWYAWCIYQYAKYFPDSIVAQFATHNFGIKIDGIFLSGKDKFEFKRSSLFPITKRDIMEFELLLNDLVTSLVRSVKSNILPFRQGTINGSCITKYGPCKFFGPCAAPDDIATGHILKNNFVQVDYNPLNFS